MVKYFGDAQHGQIMLQESSEVSIGSPVIIVIICCLGLNVVIGSLACWKFSSTDKAIEKIQALLVPPPPVLLPLSDLTLTEEKHAFKLGRWLHLSSSASARTYTLPTVKSGMKFCFMMREASAGIINITAGDTVKGGVAWLDDDASLAASSGTVGDHLAYVAATNKKLVLTAPKELTGLCFVGHGAEWVLTGTVNDTTLTSFAAP